MTDGPAKSGRRGLKWVWRGALVILVGAVIGWSAAVVFLPPKNVLDSTKYTTVTVASGQVGASINLSVVAKWSSAPIAVNLASGTVTTVNVTPGQQVTAGTVLYTVNLRPVVIAQGQIPAFAAMAFGGTGQDIAQLQGFLTEAGFYSGIVDGGFGYGTDRAVRAWQESLGLEADGVVRAGDIVFVPTLPTLVTLDPEKIARGSTLSGGEPVISGLSTSPAFTLPLTPAQSGLVPDKTRIEITGPGGQKWEAFAAGRQPNETKDGVNVLLAGRDGGTICGADCSSIPITGQSLLRSAIVTVEPSKGLVIPTAAILSGSDNSLSVVDVSGAKHPITVVASASGMSVVTGVPLGMVLRLPATVN